MQAKIEMRAENTGDVVLLIGQMRQMGLPELLDQWLSRYQREQRVRLGWVICIWLAYLVSEGDHRKLSVRDWVRGMRETLEQATGLSIAETDFTDDRLTIALNHLSRDETWNKIERDLARHLIQVYDLPCETIRVDATTVSGHREGGEASLWQFGHSKDNPNLRQVKVMMSALDPLGLPTAVEVAPGQSSDDELYVPVLKETFAYVGRKGLLAVGDCKMSALSTRGYIQGAGNYYLMPLSQVGEVAAQMPAWIEAGVALGAKASKVIISDDEGNYEIARGYEVKRSCTYQAVSWDERVLIVRSHAYAQAQARSLDERLQKAQAQLLALTPPVGRGRRQIKDEKTLLERAEAILANHEVTGLLTYHFTKDRSMSEKLVGRGRDGPNRERRVVEQVRYQISEVRRNEESIAKQVATFGWRAYGTNAPRERLSFEKAVLCYRSEFLIERVFGRFKGDRLAIAPMFVKRDDQVEGLTRLLSLAVRVLTLMEFVVRRALGQQQRKLAGLYLDSPAKTTAKPTAERLLRVFSPIKLVSITSPESIVSRVTGFSSLHQEIIDLLGLPQDLYTSLIKTVIRVSKATLQESVSPSEQKERYSHLSAYPTTSPPSRSVLTAACCRLLAHPTVSPALRLPCLV
jgi:transposase